MKKITNHFFTNVLCFALYVCFTNPLLGQTGSAGLVNVSTLPQFQTGKIYLKLKDSYSIDLSGYPVISDPDIASVMAEYNVVKVEKPFAALGTTRFDRTYRVSFNDTANTDSLIIDLQSLGSVEYAERVPMMYPQIIPNDPLLTGSQYFWNMINADGVSNIYQTNPAAAVNAIVAIVDDAVMTTHEDLAANIWGFNRDVADLDNDPNPPFTGAAATNGVRFSHGTHVSGIAGGVTNNGLGIASVGWSNNIMGIKTRMSSDAGFGLPFAYDGVVWAIANGAQVINMSWGGAPASITEYNILLTAQTANIVLVAAAGNSGMGTAFYPAAYGEGATGTGWEVYDRTLVIAVAALDINNNRSVWTGGFGTPGSNFGPWVDVSAYGTAIRSSISNSLFGGPVINQYADYDGTSMAAPMVSGIAGVMRSFNPGATALDVYNCIVYSSNPDIYGALHPTNTVNTLGHGRLDAEAALQCSGVPCTSNPVAIISPSATTLCPGGNVTLTANAGVGYLWSTTEVTQSIVVNTAGTYNVTVTFSGGCTSTASVTITNVNPVLTLDVFENSGIPNDGIMCGPGSSSNAFSFCASATGSTYAWTPFGFMGWGQCTGIMSLGSVVPDMFTMSVTVNDMYGCPGLVGVANFTINAVAPPVVAIAPPTPSSICVGQSVGLNASGATTYAWLPTTGLSSPSIANPIASPIVTTTYTVTGTSVSGCTATATVTITVNTTPTVNPVANISTCAGTVISASSFSSTPSGATYTWTNSNTAIGLAASGVGNVPSFTSTNSGTSPIVATITVTPTLGSCVGASFVYTITVNPLPTVSVSPAATTIISGGSVLITASGSPATYSWSPAVGLSNPSIANPLASPTVTTTYVVTATNSYGCTSTASTTITVTPAACGICNEMAPSGVLSISPPQYTVYCITTPMTISGTVSISLSEVRMAPGVTITVPSGAILNINGSHLYSCTDMWQGIIVQPGGAVNIQYYGAIVPGVGLIKRSPCIEDAIVAVDIPSNSTVTNNPLTVSNATFNRNQTSIRISNYTTTAIGTAYPMSIVNSVFTSRRINFTPGSLNWVLTNTIKAMVASDPLATPYIDNISFPDNTPVLSYLKAPFAGAKPLAGIVLQKIGVTNTPATTPVYFEMKIGAPGVPNYNVFDNLYICINASDANFTCVNNIFQKTYIAQGGGIAINAQCKEISNNRLQVIPAAATNFINKFYDCGRSINSVNYFENIATYCEVRSTYAGVPPAATPANYNGKYGFFIVTNRFNAINLSNNKIYNIESPITFNGNLGPYSLGGPVITGQYSGQIDINSNTMDRTLTGSTVVNPFIANAITVTNVISSSITPIPGKIVNVNANTLTNVYRGVRISNWAKKDIKTNDNTITMVVDPFTFSTPTPTQYGIVHTTNSAALSYGNNIINNTVTGPGITANDKIRAIGTSLCQNQIVRCNKVLNIYKGIEFQGSNPNTSFNHNDMTGNRYGFVLDNAGYIGPQGSLTSPSDNRWLGLPVTWTGPNYKTATLATTTASTAVSSELYVRSAAGVFNPNGSGYTATTYFLTDYFNNGSAASTIKYITTNPLYVACPVSAVCCFGVGSGVTAKMEQIVQNLDPLINNIDQTRFINKNQVYRMLKDDPSLAAGSTILENFYLASATTTKETFSLIEDDIVLGNIVGSQSKTAGIIPTNTIEDNYKTFFTMYLKDQTDSITSSDSLNLVAIAQGCPFTDGAVVYQARALYNSIYMSNVVFEDDCEASSTRQFNINNSSEITSFRVNLYPNPTPGEFTLDLNGIDNSKWLISITDIQGRIVLTETSYNNMVQLKPDAENGVYLVHITNTLTNETAIKKLVIQK